MKNKLHDFFINQSNTNVAIAHGLAVHRQLQFVDMDNPGVLVDVFARYPQLVQMFGNDSRAEVPVAGYVDGRFISRRIDRLHIDNRAKIINILDFKTDSDKESRFLHYKKQLNEYKQILSDIYPDYQINCSILWTHDWTLQQII